MNVWYFKKITTQWTGSLEKANLVLRLLREFYEVQERQEELGIKEKKKKNIIGRTLATSIYVRTVTFIFSSVNVVKNL